MKKIKNELEEGKSTIDFVRFKLTNVLFVKKSWMFYEYIENNHYFNQTTR